MAGSTQQALVNSGSDLVNFSFETFELSFLKKLSCFIPRTTVEIQMTSFAANDGLSLCIISIRSLAMGDRETSSPSLPRDHFPWTNVTGTYLYLISGMAHLSLPW